MRRFVVLLLVLGVGVVLGRMFDGVTNTTDAQGREEKCATENGDVNGDGTVNLSDAVTILSNLFLGNPPELVPLCEPQTRSGLPDTGQTTCYGQDGKVIACTSDTCAGQDGFYTTGCPSEGRFVVGRM